MPKTKKCQHCLVAMELKVGKFKPEYVSKMDFYLEELDRQIKKSDENPSVGLHLCASKNDEVVAMPFFLYRRHDISHAVPCDY
jgi:hypothetical protein